MRNIKDKEGVVFSVVNDPKVESHMRNRDSVKFMIDHIQDQLHFYNVNPINGKVGFHGDIDALAYYFAGLIDLFYQCYNGDKTTI
jgi:hypothetical protein